MHELFQRKTASVPSVGAIWVMACCFAPLQSRETALPAGAVRVLGDTSFCAGSLGAEEAEYRSPHFLYSPDGIYIAVVSDRSRKRGTYLLDARNGRDRRYLEGAGYYPDAMAFSFDSSLFAMVIDNKVSVYHVQSGRKKYQFDLGKLSGNAVAWTQNRQWLAVAAGPEILLYDLHSGKLKRKWKAHTEDGKRLNFSPDGKWLHSAHWSIRSQKKVVERIWSMQNHDLVEERRGSLLDPVRELSHARRGRFIVAGNEGRAALLQSTPHGLHPVQKVPTAFSVSLSPDQSRAVWATEHGLVCRDAVSGQHLWTFRTAAVLLRTAFSPGGHVVAGLDLLSGRIVRVDARTGKPIRSPETTHGSLSNLAAVPHNMQMGSSEPEGSIAFWNLSTGKLLYRMIDRAKIWEYCIAPKLKVMALVHKKYISIVDLQTGKRRATLPRWDKDTTDYWWDVTIRFRPDGESLIITEKSGTTWQWNWPVSGAQQKLLYRATGFRSYLGPHARYLGYNLDLESAEAHLVDLTRRAKVISWLAPKGWTFKRIAEDHSLVVLLDRRRTVMSKMRLCDLATGGTLDFDKVTLWHHAPVSFSHDHRHLIIYQNNLIELWSIAENKLMGTFPGPRSFIDDLKPVPHRSQFAAATAEGTVLIYDYTKYLKPQKRPWTVKEMESHWRGLTSKVVHRNFVAMDQLIRTPKQTATLLAKKISPRSKIDAMRIRGWIKDLTDSKFPIREKATRALEKAEEQATPALRAALQKQPTLDQRRRIERLLQRLHQRPLSPEHVRAIRAVSLLERLGTKEAVALLKQWAGGAKRARLTRLSKEALGRLRW